MQNIGDLLYIKEHLSCRNYVTDVNTGFKYEEIPAGASLRQESVTQNYLRFFIEGECMITSGFYPQRRFKAGEMILIPKSSLFDGTTITQVKVLVFCFDIPLSSCDKFILESYVDYAMNTVYDFSPLPIRTPMNEYVNLMAFLLKRGMRCIHLFEIKHKEFFLLLRGFYSKEEIVSLLYPIIGNRLTFKDFILSNYTKVYNIDELIDRSHLSRSSFFETFKENFGITAKQWMLKQQAKAVAVKAGEPHVSVKDLMQVIDYTSPTQFNRFCHKYFGCTPRELIEKRQA